MTLPERVLMIIHLSELPGHPYERRLYHEGGGVTIRESLQNQSDLPDANGVPETGRPQGSALTRTHAQTLLKIFRTPRRTHTVSEYAASIQWPSLATYCFSVVNSCPTCAQNRVMLQKNRKPMYMFPTVAPLELMSIALLGELIQTARGSRFLLGTNDRFSKLTHTAPLK